MKPITADDPLARSADVVAENIEALKALFPEAVTEGKIDFDVLKQLLGGAVEEHEEKYGLNWHGKRRARQLALTPSTGTLRPCPEESVDWDTTQNLMIEGDNLEVLKLLQKSYAGKVKLIYIDPPYNTGKDFVYRDDFHDNIKNYQMLTGQVDSNGHRISSNAEASGRFHTDWLNMMYPRLRLARDLLRPDGAIFITIDDNETFNLRHVLNDVFGEDNFVANIVWNHTKQSKNDEPYFSRHHNQVLVFRKSDALPNLRFARTAQDNVNYSNPDNDAKGEWRSGDVRSPHLRTSLKFRIETPSGRFIDPPENGWRWSEESVLEKIATGEIVFSQDETRIIRKIYLTEQEGRTPENIWLAEFAGTTRQANAELKEIFEGEPPFDTPKPTTLLQKIVSLVAVGEFDIVVDFFAGSGTTGSAVMTQNANDGGNRRFVLVQLPEPLDPDKKDQKTAAAFCDKLTIPRNIAELTKERLRRAAKRIRNETPDLVKGGGMGDLGFRVFKLDSSNLRAWDTGSADVDRALLGSVEHIKPDRSENDVLYELLLKLGLDLCVPIEERTIAGKVVHSIGAGALIVCLAEKITRDEIEPLAHGIVAWHKELAPPSDTTVVLRDSAFADDVTKTNMTAILQQHGLANVRSL